jgi:cytochrome c553
MLAYCTAARPEYNIGNDVPPENKILLIERAEKGNTLFKIHCASCHGIYTKGKADVPNFTTEQIDNYKARTVMAFKNHSKVRNLSMEQFDYIFTFLRLRKVKQG